MDDSTPIEVLIEQAKAGNKAALELVIQSIQTQIYNLALRMLWHPADAEDASQEILVKVVVHLGQFRQESSFSTWVYRIAANHLLTTRKRRAEMNQITFEQVSQELENRMDTTTLAPTVNPLEQKLLLDEVQLRCTLGMLLCLDREQRLAYILGEILEVSSEEGAAIMASTPANFRKRLSRARERIRTFMQSNCGIVNPANPCRCEHQLAYKIKHEKLAPNRLLFAYPESKVRAYIAELKQLDRAVALYRRQPEFAAPESLVQAIKGLVNSAQFETFN